MVLRGFSNDNDRRIPRSHSDEHGRTVAQVLGSGNWIRQVLSGSDVAPIPALWQGQPGLVAAADVVARALEVPNLGVHRYDQLLGLVDRIEGYGVTVQKIVEIQSVHAAPDIHGNTVRIV